MGKTLILTEKPSVGRDIARVLGCRHKGDGCLIGGQYIVTWALGHLVTLADPEAYGDQYKHWSLDTLPMLPEKMQLVVIPQTGKQFRAVQSLMKRSDITDLVIATDSGREGELVARWIMEKAHCRKPAKRLWISSQTDKAIKEGFQHLRPAKEYDNLYRSAEARAKADWLIGLNVTRALTCKHNAQLSAGRVQTPTLALIVQREEEIKRFKPRDYWNLHAAFDGFNALWRDSKGQSMIFDQAEAERLCASLKGKTAVIAELKREFKQQSPPAAYDLTELQRDANRKYAYSAKQTLSIMQSLYETHKLLTYPRTDSRYISDDVVPTLPDRLRAVKLGAYAPFVTEILKSKPLSTRYLVNNAKVTDHHAIIPTEEPLSMARLSPEERNVYDLVVRRFLAVLSQPYQYEDVRVRLTVDKQSFYAKGKIIKNAGWKALYGASMPGDEEQEDDLQEQTLPNLRQGDKLPIRSVSLKALKTKPPARYNEATLLSAMENPSGQVEDKKLRDVLAATSGLGTPATRADIIEKLFDTFYVERRGKEIVPTSKGIQLVSIVPPDLRSAELTAKWEQQLSLISKGQAKDSAFINEMRRYAARLVSGVVASDAKYVHDNVSREKCPDCGKFLLTVNGKRGKMLVCPDRECGYRRSVTQTTNARCPNCHKKMELRGEGDKRLFTCICGYREKLSDFEAKRQQKGAGKRDVQQYLQKQSAPTGNAAFAGLMDQWKQKGK